MIDITAMGELLIDFTPHGLSESGRALFEQNPGGAPANVLAAAQKQGCSTAFIGKVGDDMHGSLLKNTLQEHGIRVDGLLSDPNFFTTLAFVQLDKGERTFSFARKPGADTQIRPEEVREDILEDSFIFHFGSLSLTDEPSRSATRHAVQAAKKAGAVISYDPNYRAPLWRSQAEAEEQMRSLLSYVDIMKLSDEETTLLTGVEDPVEASRKLLDMGISCVVVTLGSEGAMISTRNFSLTEKGQARKVVDTTGAGDAFWGGLLSRFAENRVRPENLTEKDASEFVKFANVVAGICVEKRGAIPAMPTREEALAEYSLR